MAGAFGNAILFVTIFLCCVLLSLWTLALSAYYYLLVVQDTAAGVDKVVWPNEPIHDWIFKPVYLCWLAALWLVPASWLSSALRSAFLPHDHGLRFLVLALPGLWLFFPISLLSSLGARSAWVPFRPAVLLQMARVLPAVVLFYGMSGLLILTDGALWHAALFRNKAWLLPVAAAGTGAVLLIHARLLGRLAWLIQLRTPVRPAQPSRQEAAGPPRKRKKKRPVRKPIEAHDPWAAPAEEESAPKKKSPALEEAYEVREAEGTVVPDLYSQPPEGPGMRVPVEPSEEPAVELPDGAYGVADDRPVEVAKGEGVQKTRKDPKPAPLSEVTGRERDLMNRAGDPPPASPMFSGVYSFPWYGTSARAWLWLSLLALATGISVRGAISFWPS